MAADHGMDAVRADEHIAAHGLAHQPELCIGEMRHDAALVLDEALQLQARPYGARTEPGDDGVVDRFLQPAAMNGELRKVEAGVRAAQFAPHLLAETADVVQFLGADAHRIELRHEVERGELLDRVRQNVDADAQLPDLGSLFKNDGLYASPMKHEGERQAADARARNEHFHRSFSPSGALSPCVSGGGRKSTSCLAERATTSAGVCSGMLWMAQNRS